MKLKSDPASWDPGSLGAAGRAASESLAGFLKKDAGLRRVAIPGYRRGACRSGLDARVWRGADGARSNNRNRRIDRDGNVGGKLAEPLRRFLQHAPLEVVGARDGGSRHVEGKSLLLGGCDGIAGRQLDPVKTPGDVVIWIPRTELIG